MRIGGELKAEYSNPEEWIALVKQMRYSAVLSPVDCTASQSLRDEYRRCAQANDVVIGEVGVWRNTLSPDDNVRREATEYAKNQLALADELSASCCVNIAGNRGEVWDGFSVGNYSEDTYALIVDMVRDIIDSVRPVRTFYTLEPMPWMMPDSPQTYLRLIKDIDRKAFGVHLDYVNMLSSPYRYVNNAAFIAECFELLGPYIRSIHAKDAYMENGYTTLIHEVMPGKGVLDYVKILPLVESLGTDMTLFVEHLPDREAYAQACAFIRAEGEKAGVNIKG